MAKIEDLIAQIPDERLKKALSVEVKALKKTKKFGLVFEEHLPETVRLPKLPVREGALVALKGEAGNQLWRVKSIRKGIATCEKAVEGYPLPNEASKEFLVAELISVRSFGDPIYPALIPIDRVQRGGADKPWHMLINADNFHALQLLLYAYEGQVDVIYIDPPYNTGARDWKYNNDFVDTTDQWRHSKWLSMMKKRLLLANRLLKPDGVLIVTIDDYEACAFGILLDEIFPDKSRAVIAIKYNPAGTTRNGFSRCHEYAFYVLNHGQEVEKKPAPPDIRDQNLRRHGNGANRQDSPTMFYPIHVDKVTLKVIGAGQMPAKDFHPHAQTVKLADRYEIWPLDNKGREKRWYYGRERVQDKGHQELTSKWQKESLHVYFHTDNLSEQKYQSVWIGSEYDAGAHGGSMVRDITGREFPFPKSLYAVRDCLNAIVRNRKNALILDFFGGSGTTYHATALLNAKDGGNRRCLLVTNNEVTEKLGKQLNEKGLFPGDDDFEKHGICTSVTWPRCKYVTQGHRDDGTPLPGQYLAGGEMKVGFNENFEYFQLKFLDPAQVARGDAFQAILPILWMMTGCRGEREDSKGSAAWFIPKKSPFAVLLKEKDFCAFREKMAERKDIEWIFLVTDSEENFATMRRTLGRKFECVQLYQSYLENFRLNTQEALA